MSRAQILRALGKAAAISLLAAIPVRVDGQAIPGLPRPSGDRLPPPDLERPAGPPSFALPPLPEADAQEEGAISSGATLVVREFRVDGVTAFSREEIAALTAPYTNRPVTIEDLERLRRELTLIYVNAGYVNSGAILPDQRVTNGVVEYRVVEGRLSGIEILQREHFRESHLRRRLALAASVPLDVHRIEQRLQILQRDERIRRVDAELVPGSQPGEAILRARFDEENPFRAALDASNYESPTIGSYRGRLLFAHRNLTGRADVLDGSLAFTAGSQEYQLGYEIPITPWDTTVGWHVLYNDSDVVEEPFAQLDIASESRTVAIGLAQPVLRTQHHAAAVSLTGEWRESRTFLFDEPFSFPPLPPSQDGRTRITVLRFGQEWIYRDLRQVVAARSILSRGLDLLGATELSDGLPDASFFAWLGQLQWARRFDGLRGLQILARTDVQLAAEPLVSLEQFELGGHASVRGYRENFLVRDSGVVASVEVRLPLLRDAIGAPVFQLALFHDWGRAWNTDRGEPLPKQIASVGVGIRASFARRIEGQLYWAHRLDEVEEPADDDLQDRGIQFELTFHHF